MYEAARGVTRALRIFFGIHLFSPKTVAKKKGLNMFTFQKQAFSVTGLAVFAALLLGATPASASNFSFTGTFGQDDTVQFFNFSVGATSDVTLLTYSYAGGTQADGNVVSDGGFDPILALFDASTGNLIDQNDDGSDPDVGIDPVTGNEYDTFLQTSLAAGDYTVAIMQFDNFAVGPALADGFLQTGGAFFTNLLFGCSAGQFCDTDNVSRTNEWAFDILNVNGATEVPNVVPLPAALPLFLTGLAGIGLLRRRQRQA